MSLDCVEMSLGRAAFSCQLYGPFPGPQRPEGLRVLDFDPMVVPRQTPRAELLCYPAAGQGPQPGKRESPSGGRNVAVWVAWDARGKGRPKTLGWGWQSLLWLHWSRGQEEGDAGPPAVTLGMAQAHKWVSSALI